MTYSRILFIAKGLSASLVMMYALVPILLDASSIYAIPWAEKNFWYSLALALMIIMLPSYKFHKYVFRFDHKSNAHIKTIALFGVCCVVFSLWPWHDDRESLGASLAAFFRVAWVLNVFCFVNAPERSRIFAIVLTVILVFIDQSRTYFMIAFMVLALASERKLLYFFLGLLGVLLVAATRVGESMSALGMLTYGIIGEGYNGTKAVGQVLALDVASLDKTTHFFLTMLQPIYTPFEIFIGRIFGIDLPSQSSVLDEAVRYQLGEKLSPMGGWYIVADFIWYGPIGLLFMWFYINISWLLSNLLLNTRYFPIGAFFFFLAVKSTPFVYQKALLYVILIALIFTILGFYKNKRLRYVLERRRLLA